MHRLSLHVLILVGILTIFITTSTVIADCGRDACRNTYDLIASKGYPVEEHFVTTPDSYILRLFRITGGQGGPNNGTGKPCVFLQHGILDSSDTWVLNEAHNSLGFMLADAGYDVWLGNTRGNVYSRNSTKYNPDGGLLDHRFWDWSYDEMGIYDVPTVINYTLLNNGNQQLMYVAHSQGTTQMFVNGLNPQYSVKNQVAIFVALAPVTYLYNTKSLLLKAVADFDLDGLVNLLGVYEFLPSSWVLKVLLPSLCDATPWLCDFVIYSLCGFDASDFNATRLDTYMAHFPNGVSMKEITHFAQSLRSNVFSYYDYGIVGNLQIYNQTTPPSYNLSQWEGPPTVLFYGGQDDLGDTSDVENNLLKYFPPQYLKGVHLNQQFGHLDYVWGENATNVYDQVIALGHEYYDILTRVTMSRALHVGGVHPQEQVLTPHKTRQIGKQVPVQN